MEIRGLMQLKGAKIIDFGITPAEKKPTVSLKIEADLTPELADIMRCQDALYLHTTSRVKGEKVDEFTPHKGITRSDLGEAMLRDVDVSLPSHRNDGPWDSYRPELVYKFSFHREDTDSEWRITMLMRFKGKEEELAGFVAKQGIKEFEYAVRSLQNEFDWTGAQSGTPVPLSDGTNNGAQPEPENRSQLQLVPPTEDVAKADAQPQGPEVVEPQAAMEITGGDQARDESGRVIVTRELPETSFADRLRRDASEGGPEAAPEFTRGDRVRIVEGKFARRTGEVKNKNEATGKFYVTLETTANDKSYTVLIAGESMRPEPKNDIAPSTSKAAPKDGKKQKRPSQPPVQPGRAGATVTVQ